MSRAAASATAIPFIAEDGCAVYLPEDYFHLKGTETIRLGRFTTIPIAQILPAAKDALDSLSEETEVEVVPLKSLSPRELTQNTGLPQREAELARQRDFDELFFFAGAAEADIARFQNAATEKKIALRQHGVMWSAAVGATCRPACATSQTLRASAAIASIDYRNRRHERSRRAASLLRSRNRPGAPRRNGNRRTKTHQSAHHGNVRRNCVGTNPGSRHNPPLKSQGTHR